MQIIKAAQQLGGFFLPPWMRSSCGPRWAQPICTTRVDYRLEYDFCPICRAVFAVHGELTEPTILNFWAYKNSQGMRQPVDPAVVPPAILFGPSNAIVVDPGDLRLEMITLSEALHIWDLPGEFFSSQAYRDGDGPLNLIEYLEEIRSTTLRRARRVGFANALSAPTSKRANPDEGPGNTEMATIPGKYASSARVPVPSDRLTDVRGRRHLSTTACATSYTLNPTMVYQEDGTEEVNLHTSSRSPKGKEKATDFPLPGEYQYPESANSVEQDYEAARQASVKHIGSQRHSGDAGPSKAYESLGASTYPDGASSDAGSSDQVPVAPSDHGTPLRKVVVRRKPILVVATKSPVLPMKGVIENASDVDCDGYQTDYTEYDSDKSPRKIKATKSLYDEINEVDSQASSPLISPASANLDSSLNHPLVGQFPTDTSSQRPSVFRNRPWDSGRPDSETIPTDILPHPTTPDTSLFPSMTRPSGGYGRFDRPDSQVLPVTLFSGPVKGNGAFAATTSHPLPDLPCDMESSETSPDAHSQLLANAEADSNAYASRASPHQPVPNASNDSLPDGLAQHMADIDALFPHQFRPSPSGLVSEVDGASSPPTLSSPLGTDRNGAGYVFYNPHNHGNPFQSLPIPSPPLSAGRIAAVAQHAFLSSPLVHTSFASPQPRAAPRIGTPPLARTPSAELQSLYRDAIRTGRAVLHAPPPPTPADDVTRATRRKSVVGMFLSATPKMESEEAAQWREGPWSAPPFTSRGARQFEEVAVTAVCLCEEVGRSECMCPQVVEPTVWM